MSPQRTLWVGYEAGGERATVEVGGPGSKVLLLGSRASELAALAAVASKEAGARTVIFDLDGYISNRLSGLFDTFDYRSFLYDAFRLEEPEAWHSQMAAAAYAVALDLSVEEEAIVNSAMQVVASEGSLLSPVALHDVIGKVEGFRGFHLDRLSGRIGTLKHFDAVDDQSFSRLAKGNVIVDFHRASYPLAGELALALFVAKVLAHTRSNSDHDLFFLLTEAHRLFRSSPRPLHQDRLLSALVGSHSTVAFGTDQPASLSPRLLDSCPVILFSNDAMSFVDPNGKPPLPGSCILEDRRRPSRFDVYPRLIVTKTGEYVAARASRFPNPGLTGAILEVVGSYPLSTPESVVNFLSAEFLTSDVVSALDSLQRQGALVLEPKETGSGPRCSA